jgi:hypothetical protein
MGGDTDSQIESIRTSELNINKKDLVCAPGVQFVSGSCISLDMLIKMAKAYNKNNTTTPIKLDDTVQIMSPNKYKKYLVRQFQKRLEKCNDQKCWTKQDFMKHLEAKLKKQLLKETFRPIGPVADATQKHTWLNTTNIDDSMRQYENKYKDFFYLGTVPLDFEKLDYYVFKNIDFNKYIEEGKRRFGTVINLDKSYQSGSHWVSLFFNFDSGEICYSDSYATNPEPEIAKFIQKVGKFIKTNLNKEPLIKINRTRHQRGGSECGVYSMEFILRLLSGESFEQITAKRIPDEEVNKCRNIYFRNAKDDDGYLENTKNLLPCE